MKDKPVWYLFLYDDKLSQVTGIGEYSFIPGLSVDVGEKINEKLTETCDLINKGEYDFEKPVYGFPGLNFALETAILDLKSNGTKVLFPSEFTNGKKGIPVNGLIWMASPENMLEQVEDKINKGFRCIKLKIGAIGFKDELSIIRNIRRRFTSNELEIRVDANGAYNTLSVFDVLEMLAELQVHSVEQPIMPSQIDEMALLCKNSPVPIALDEELLGICPFENKRKLIETIRPHYLVLKPGLLGGFQETGEWIKIAAEFNAGWWVTSALESNIGLNAISQWTYTLENNMYQGLGTGSLYSSNIGSPLEVHGEELYYNVHKKWNYEFIY